MIIWIYTIILTFKEYLTPWQHNGAVRSGESIRLSGRPLTKAGKRPSLIRRLWPGGSSISHPENRRPSSISCGWATPGNGEKTSLRCCSDSVRKRAKIRPQACADSGYLLYCYYPVTKGAVTAWAKYKRHLGSC